MTKSNMAHTDGHTVEPKEQSENQFVYHVEIPTLQSLASYRIVLSVLDRLSEDYDNYWRVDDVHKLIYFLKVPRPIEAILKNSLKKVCDEMSKWEKHIKGYLFLDTFIPECAVWLPNGEIDYLESAINMLNSGKLNEIDDFSIKLHYCMEDEIDKTVINDSIQKHFFKDVNFEEYPFKFYWFCFMKNQLHEIPLGDRTSIAGAVAQWDPCFRTEPTVFEYFWNRMSFDDRRSVISYFIFLFHPKKTARIIHTVERLFLSMPWSQQNLLFSKHGVPEKIIKFGFKVNSPRIALWAWNHCKDTFTADRFEKMFNDMLGIAASDDQKMRTLIEIWDTAANSLKNHRNVVEKNYWLRYWQGHCNSCYQCHICAQLEAQRCPKVFEFYYKMCRSPDQRCSSPGGSCVSYDFALSLVKRVSGLGSMIKIFEEYTPHSTERSEFRNNIPKFDFYNHCISLLNVGDFDGLLSTVEWFTEGNAHKARIFYQKLFRYSEFGKCWKKTCLINDTHNWIEFCKLYEFTYPDNSSLAYKKKLELVSWMGLKCEYETEFRNSVDNMFKILNKAFVKKDLNRIKNSFLSSFRKTFRLWPFWEFEHECDVKFIEKFVCWCLSDDQYDIYEFKRNVAATIIYDRIIDRMERDDVSIRPMFVEILLDRLDNYLMWCLETQENVRAFKISKMKRPDRNLENFRRLVTEPDANIVKILLKWCFDGQVAAMKRFRKRRIEKWRKING